MFTTIHLLVCAIIWSPWIFFKVCKSTVQPFSLYIFSAFVWNPLSGEKRNNFLSLFVGSSFPEYLNNPNTRRCIDLHVIEIPHRQICNETYTRHLSDAESESDNLTSNFKASPKYLFLFHILPFKTYSPLSAWIILAAEAGIQPACHYSPVPNPHDDILFADTSFFICNVNRQI